MAKDKVNISNPFVTTGYAGGDYFCDREKETQDLVRYLTNENNVALISPRRYGKSDLLRHCFAQKEISDHYYTFIVDIYSTKTTAEMVAKLGSSILETLKPKGKKTWEKFLAILASVRSGISFDMNGQPSWTMSVGDIHSPSVTLDEIFAYLKNADRPCLVAIDEFQQITKYDDPNIEAELRTHVQYCSNAHFVFSGSRRELMGTIFTSPARPFYQSVTLYHLNRLPLDKYADFCITHFKKRGKTLDISVVNRLYEQFDGVTYYMQRVMNEMFSKTETGYTCVESDISKAVDEIINVSSAIYEDLMYQLPDKQSRVLIAIAKEGNAVNVTSGSFTKRYGLVSPNSVKSAIPALIDRGLITHDKGVYKVYDLFFAIWLIRNFI